MAISQKRVEKKNQVLQWHPAFFAGLQIELEEDADCLEFIQEYSLGTKPMEIDVLIKKEETRVLKKSIGKIFRKHNIIEYKSPMDYLSVDDYYKAYGYAYFYKADRVPVNEVLLEELTISLVSERYPKKLLGYLKKQRGFLVIEKYPGIYYVEGDVLPVQIVVTSRLAKEESLWLRNLTNKLKSRKDAEELVREYEKHYKNVLYESLMDIIVEANEEKFEEVKEMCEALRRLMKDELEAERMEGEEIGEKIGKEKGERQMLLGMNRLILKLSELGRMDDMVKAAKDKEYQEKLFREFGL